MVAGMSGSTYIIERACLMCGKSRLIEVDRNAYKQWLRQLLRDEPEDREFTGKLDGDELSLLKHGYCHSCYLAYVPRGHSYTGGGDKDEL